MGELKDPAPSALDAQLAAADQGGASAPAADPAAPGAPAAPAPEQLDAEQVGQWVAFAQQLGELARSMCPEETAHWTPARLEALGVALARCARRYGWTFGDAMTHPVLGLAFAAAPLAWPFIRPYVLGMLKPAAKGGRGEASQRAAAPAGMGQGVANPEPAASPQRPPKVDPIA